MVHPFSCRAVSGEEVAIPADVEIALHQLSDGALMGTSTELYVERVDIRLVGAQDFGGRPDSGTTSGSSSPATLSTSSSGKGFPHAGLIVALVEPPAGMSAGVSNGGRTNSSTLIRASICMGAAEALRRANPFRLFHSAMSLCGASESATRSIPSAERAADSACEAAAEASCAARSACSCAAATSSRMRASACACSAARASESCLLSRRASSQAANAPIAPSTLTTADTQVGMSAPMIFSSVGNGDDASGSDAPASSAGSGASEPTEEAPSFRRIRSLKVTDDPRRSFSLRTESGEELFIPEDAEIVLRKDPETGFMLVTTTLMVESVDIEVSSRLCSGEGGERA